MPDWKKAAQAMALNIPDAQLDAISPSLDALEKAYRPLPATLTAEDDPAPLFAAFPDDER
jgi:hypothetical protein